MRLLSRADPEVEAEQIGSPLLGQDEAAFPPSGEEYRVFHGNGSGDSTVVSGSRNDNPSITVQDTSRANSDPKLFYSFPNSPYHKAANLPRPASASTTSVVASEEDEEDDGVLEFPARRRITEPTSSIWQSRQRRFRRKVGKLFRKICGFMTAPLLAALLSLIVACIRPLQHALEDHVQPIKGALTQAGNCSIPLTLVVLGAYFYTPPDPDQERSGRVALPSSTSRRGRSISTNWSQLSLVDNVREMFKMKKRSPSEESRAKQQVRPGETKTVIIAIMSRMIITPLLLLPMMALSTRFNLQKVFDEYVIIISCIKS